MKKQKPANRKKGVSKSTAARTQASAEAKASKDAVRASRKAGAREPQDFTSVAKAKSTKVKATPAEARPFAQKTPVKPQSKGLGAQKSTPAGASAKEATPYFFIAGLRVPPILLEGDEPTGIAPSIRKYSTTAAPAPEARITARPELPSTYGTDRMHLVARDPRCLYAHWDITQEHQKRLNQLSVSQNLVVRVYYEWIGNKVAAEAQVHPESDHWFVHVDRPGTTYIGQLGYFDCHGVWVAVASSPPATTPSDSAADRAAPVFVTVPPELDLSGGVFPVAAGGNAAQSVPVVEHPRSPEGCFEPITLTAQPDSVFGASSEEVERVAPTLQRQSTPVPISPERPKSFPQATPFLLPAAAGETMSLARQEALEELIRLTFEERGQIGSEEILRLLESNWQRRSESGVSSLEAAAAISSPAPSPTPPERRFWFNINAELIIYGATEPDATVRIGSRQIRLRPDGTFSYRFSLPDGLYELPVSATSADGVEARSADLQFQRATRFAGDVAAHPQDPALAPPSASHLGA